MKEKDKTEGQGQLDWDRYEKVDRRHQIGLRSSLVSKRVENNTEEPLWLLWLVDPPDPGSRRHEKEIRLSVIVVDSSRGKSSMSRCSLDEGAKTYKY